MEAHCLSKYLCMGLLGRFAFLTELPRVDLLLQQLPLEQQTAHFNQYVIELSIDHFTSLVITIHCTSELYRLINNLPCNQDDH